MIFVTVGSIHFDQLVRFVNEAVGQGRIVGETVIQIANGSYEPRHCEYFRVAPGLDSYFQRADLVISSGGITNLEVLERGVRLISVSNPELIDNHQHIFLKAMESRGFILYCRQLAELPALIQTSMLNPPPPPVNGSLFFRKVVEDLEHLSPAPRRRS